MKKAVTLASVLLCLLGLAQAGAAAGRTGYYRFPAIHGDTVVFIFRRRPLDGRRPRRHGPPPDLALGHRSLSGHLARRADPGLLRPVRGPDRGLHDAPRRRAARAPHLRRPGRDRRRLDAGRKDPLRHPEVLDPAQHPARRPRPGDQRRDRSFPSTRRPTARSTPSGGTLYFTRLPFQGSYTKRYKGGTAQNLWSFALGAAEAAPLTADYAGTSKNPMVWQDRVYFLSDRDGTMNIWSMDLKGGGLKPADLPQGLRRQLPEPR